LKLLPATDSAHRRATYSLGLDSSGRSAAAGSFTIEGRFDLAGGTIDLRPATIPSQGGAGVIGLEGRSDDGGKTFAGRVTANPRCTMFTLKRVG
jgi:hypothetical protein